MKHQIKYWFFALFFFLLNPTNSHAHVKWFVDESEVEKIALAPQLTSPVVQIWGVVILILLIVIVLFDQTLKPESKKFLRQTKKLKKPLATVFQILIGASLFFTGINGGILVPHLEADSFLRISTQLFQFLVATVLLTARYPLISGVGLTVLYALTFISFGVYGALDYVNILGIGLFLIFISKFDHHHDDWDHHALPTLRILTGTSLIVLAFSEKILQPHLAMALTEQFQLNFMKLLGFLWFSDYLFVISAGFVELLFGLIFVFGFITRINAIALSVFFIATNMYFFTSGYQQEGVKEVIGHLPLFATALLLIVYGAGKRLKMSRIY